jgi:hypothetical protein
MEEVINNTGVFIVSVVIIKSIFNQCLIIKKAQEMAAFSSSWEVQRQ